jgi:hypothetical protein
MTHKIISTENYLLIVDDNQITEGDWLYSISNQLVVQSNKGSADIINSKVTVDVLYLKIIAHLPLNNSPILNGVHLLPPLEDDIDLIYENMEDSFYEKYDDALHYYSFIEGYNKFKERFKYTEEDLRKANRMGIQKHPYAFDGKEPKYKYSEDEIIKSLQQPKYPIGVECEVINCDKCVYVQGGNLSPDCCNELNPKTTTNSQGITQWVGKYIFQ